MLVNYSNDITNPLLTLQYNIISKHLGNANTKKGYVFEGKL